MLHLGTFSFGWVLFTLFRNPEQLSKHNTAAELFCPYLLLLTIFITTKLMPAINP